MKRNNKKENRMVREKIANLTAVLQSKNKRDQIQRKLSKLDHKILSQLLGKNLIEKYKS